MLSFIALDYFQKSPLLILPLIALGIFVTVFVAVTVRAMLTDKSRLEALAALPLRDGAASAEDHDHV